LLFALSRSAALGEDKTAAATLGPSTAAIDLVAFVDLECPYSSDFFFDMEKFEEQYRGQVRITFKQLPLLVHPGSPLAHEAAMAAGAQGKYFEMARLIFSNQTNTDRASLETFARQLKLNMPEFREALDRHAYSSVLQQDASEARAFGVKETPTLFLNGERLNGFQPFDVLKSKADAILAPARPRTAAPALSAQATKPEEALAAKLESQVEAADAYFRGDRNAPVTIVEFSDFQCPFCRKSVPALQELLAQRAGTVRLVYRSFPLSFHKDSELANEAALAAGAQGKFWQMHDLIFANQSSIQRDDLIGYARQLQLNEAVFLKALDQHTYAGQIAADRALGAEANVDGTPTIFVNGQRLTGVRSTAELLQIVDQQALIAKSKGASRGSNVVAETPLPDTAMTVLGDEAAPIRIAWYTDVRGALAQRQETLLHSLVEAYPGRVRVVYKGLQLPNHADSELAGRAVIAAAEQDSFWKMFEAIAEHPGPLTREDLLAMAEQQHLDSARFSQALDSAHTSSSVAADMAEQRRRAILGSPTLIIDDQRVDGIQQLSYYRAVIDQKTHADPHAATNQRARSGQ
jgi:protein-disulfide isomerase